MSRIVFDTCIFIAYNPDLLPASLLSIVVVQEMMAGAADPSQLKGWELPQRSLRKKAACSFPQLKTGLVAGRVLNSLLRGLKSKSGGKTPKLPPGEIQRIIRDVLIARTVKRAGCLLITDNIADFKKIKKFCDVRLLSGKDFFGT